jgi:hypothetical protein
MDYFAAIEMSLELNSVYVVNGTGKIACKKKMASEPEALVAVLRELGFSFTRIGRFCAGFGCCHGADVVTSIFTDLAAGFRLLSVVDEDAATMDETRRRKVELVSSPNTCARYFSDIRNHLKQYPLSSSKFAIGNEVLM